LGVVLVLDDDVVEAIPPERADHPLAERVVRGGSCRFGGRAARSVVMVHLDD
jgi:hypothetical protein